jgi:hypothetical protein
MGFYDCRCAVTGVSLKGADTALVLLQQTADGHAPIALAVKGNYNRYGSIDMLDEDEHTARVFDFFHRALRAGDLVVDEDYFRGSDYYPFKRLADVLQVFERNMNGNPRAALLNGVAVKFALISSTVWNTIARAAPPSDSPSVLFQRLFGASPIATAIYANGLNAVAAHVTEFASVDAFMRGRGLSWAPTEAGGQDYPEEMTEYLEEALRTFADSPLAQTALLNYSLEVEDLLEEEEDEDGE